MGAAKKIISNLGNLLKKSTKIGYKKGAETVLKQFAPHAGRALRKGDGSIMKTYNEIIRTLKKL